MREVQLPSWAKITGPGKIEADADSFYKEWLGLMGLEGKEITQYDLECAYQCAKLDLQLAVAGTDFVPQGGALAIRVKDTTKTLVKENVYLSRWAQCQYPKGKGVPSTGEVRALFRRIRNVPSI